MKHTIWTIGCIAVLLLTLCVGCGKQSLTDTFLATQVWDVTSSTDPATVSTTVNTVTEEGSTAIKESQTTAAATTKVTTQAATTQKATSAEVTAQQTTTKKTTAKRTGNKTVKTTSKLITKTTTQTTPSLQNTAAAYRQEVLRLVNVERTKEGLPALQYYTAAQSAADIRANEILQSFSHTRPNGETCFTALDDLGIQYYAAGENIAMGQTSPSQVVTAWMNSAGHRANILNEDFNAIVIGYKNNAWVQLFIGI